AHEVERDREQPAAALLELKPLRDVVDEGVEAPSAVQLDRRDGDLGRELAPVAVAGGHLHPSVEHVALLALEEAPQALAIPVAVSARHNEARHVTPDRLPRGPAENRLCS